MIKCKFLAATQLEEKNHAGLAMEVNNIMNDLWTAIILPESQC